VFVVQATFYVTLGTFRYTQTIMGIVLGRQFTGID
jgi:hypothetical protein